MKILTPGMRYMLIGTVLFSVGSLLIKVAGTRLPTMEILFVRGVVGITFCWVILRKAGVGMFGTRKVMLALRGLLGFSAMFCDFYAIVHLPLADALVLLFSHPVVVAVLAWLLMGEKISIGGALSILVSLIGVCLVCRPGFLFGAGSAALDPLAVTVALTSVVLTSGAILAVHTLAMTEPPAVVILYPPMAITLLAPLFAQGWVVPNQAEWCALLGMGLFMNAGQYYMTRGYAIESAARISGVSCLEIVFAAFWGLLFLGEIPNLWTIGGGALIILGVLLLGRVGVQEQDVQRKDPVSS